MARWRRDLGITPTGAAVVPSRKKKQADRAREPAETKVGRKKAVAVRTAGGNTKYRLLGAQEANVYNPKNKSFSKAKIITVIANPANPHFIRRNILTRGALVRTDIGEIRITSRPGQEGAINAVLLEAKKEK